MHRTGAELGKTKSLRSWRQLELRNGSCVEVNESPHDLRVVETVHSLQRRDTATVPSVISSARHLHLSKPRVFPHLNQQSLSFGRHRLALAWINASRVC